MTVLTASTPFDANALNVLLDINAGTTFHLVNTHLIRLTSPNY
jgi:hypothetical protein